MTGRDVQTTLNGTLREFRDIPNASGFSPSQLMFNHHPRTGLNPLVQEHINTQRNKEAARSAMETTKRNQADLVNSKIATKFKNIVQGQKVLIKDFVKNSKFSPAYLQEEFIVTNAKGSDLEVTGTKTRRSLRRHESSVKPIPDRPAAIQAKQRVQPRLPLLCLPSQALAAAHPVPPFQHLVIHPVISPDISIDPVYDTAPESDTANELDPKPRPKPKGDTPIPPPIPPRPSSRQGATSPDLKTRPSRARSSPPKSSLTTEDKTKRPTRARSKPNWYGVDSATTDTE